MLLVSTYGDKPAGNILAQALHIIATDDTVSELVRNFILKSFFVDAGIVSSSSKAKLLELAENLPHAFDNYSFKIKHVILSSVQSTGVTLSDNIERFLVFYGTSKQTSLSRPWRSGCQRKLEDNIQTHNCALK